MTVKQYRRKPDAPIEAVRWDGTAAGATPIIDWILTNGGTATYRCDFLDKDGQCNGRETDHSIAITSDWGTASANAGWWILRERNDFRPCLNTVFEANFQEVSS